MQFLLFQHVTDAKALLVRTWFLLWEFRREPNPSQQIIQMPNLNKANRKSQFKWRGGEREADKEITFLGLMPSADTRSESAQTSFLRQAACVASPGSQWMRGNPRDTFISLHCNYIWWQNYDPRARASKWMPVRRYFLSFIAHLTNVEHVRWASPMRNRKSTNAF